MKNINKLLTFLLIISVCFNVFFIIGYMKTSRFLALLKTTEGRVQLVSDRLGLDDAQREKVAGLMTELRSHQAAIKEANRALNDEFWNEIVEDEPDMQKIAALLAESTEQVETSRRLGAEYLQVVMQSLNKDQRQGLVRMIREKDFSLR